MLRLAEFEGGDDASAASPVFEGSEMFLDGWTFLTALC
jgi:hypothetical protein